MNFQKALYSLALGLSLFHLPAFARDSFPSWGREALALANRERPPARADAWVLLDRTEYSYSAGGEIELHRYRVVQVLSPAGISEAIYSLHGLGGRSARVKRLKGWNFRPTGEPVTIEKDSAFLMDPDSDEEITSAIQTTAVLPEVTTGCWLAWESVERLDLPEGPHAVALVADLSMSQVRRSWTQGAGRPWAAGSRGSIRYALALCRSRWRMAHRWPRKSRLCGIGWWNTSPIARSTWLPIEP